MTEELNAINAVYKLNGEIYDLVEEYGHPFEFETDGYSEGIKFLGKYIWTSECDEREYLEDKDEYEELYTYLKRKAHENINILATLFK